jgi:hypothetical protein
MRKRQWRRLRSIRPLSAVFDTSSSSTLPITTYWSKFVGLMYLVEPRLINYLFTGRGGDLPINTVMSQKIGQGNHSDQLISVRNNKLASAGLENERHQIEARHSRRHCILGTGVFDHIINSGGCPVFLINLTDDR